MATITNTKNVDILDEKPHSATIGKKTTIVF